MAVLPREPPTARIRTTNGLERFDREIKRRTTNVVRIFPNRGACLRLVTALAVEQSEEWLTGSRRCLNMDELEEQRGSRAAEREEVVLVKR